MKNFNFFMSYFADLGKAKIRSDFLALGKPRASQKFY